MPSSPCKAACKLKCCAKKPKYECPPPTPEIIRCSVCHTAERDGNNIWSCVNFFSYFSYMGSTLGDIVMHILNMLPSSIITWLGIGHPKSCSIDTPVRCQVEKSEPVHKKARRLCPPGSGDHQKESSSGEHEALLQWIKEECQELAKELADLKKLTCDGDSDDQRELLNARYYVLDRLAEMLSHADKEKRAKKKKH